MPEDLEKHKENTIKGIEDFHCSVAIAQRGFKHKGIFKQITTAARWALYYRFNKHKIWDHGNFLMSVLDKDAVIRLLKIVHSSYVERLVGNDKSLPKVELHQLIAIPMSKNDVITMDNLDDTNLPHMMSEDLDLAFIKSTEELDKTTHVQVRLISSSDWNRVNWKTYELLEEDQECVHLDSIILHVHGGGFITGSTASSQANTREWALETKCPVFSVDYRLSPEYKFP